MHNTRKQQKGANWQSFGLSHTYEKHLKTGYLFSHPLGYSNTANRRSEHNTVIRDSKITPRIVQLYHLNSSDLTHICYNFNCLNWISNKENILKIWSQVVSFSSGIICRLSAEIFLNLWCDLKECFRKHKEHQSLWNKNFR